MLTAEKKIELFAKANVCTLTQEESDARFERFAAACSEYEDEQYDYIIETAETLSEQCNRVTEISACDVYDEWLDERFDEIKCALYAAYCKDAGIEEDEEYEDYDEFFEEEYCNFSYNGYPIDGPYFKAISLSETEFEGLLDALGDATQEEKEEAESAEEEREMMRKKEDEEYERLRKKYEEERYAKISKEVAERDKSKPWDEFTMDILERYHVILGDSWKD